MQATRQPQTAKLRALTKGEVHSQPAICLDHAPASAESPCVHNCCLDLHDVCLGCGRHVHDIVGWHQADEPERRAILERAAKWRAEHAPLRVMAKFRLE